MTRYAAQVKIGLAPIHHIEMEKIEDDVYVTLSSELNVSSFGVTSAEAKESIKEAIEGFLEECREMRTLDEVHGKYRQLIFGPNGVK